MIRRLLVLAFITLTSLATDCLSEPVRPTFDRVAGEYRAFSLYLMEGDSLVADLLEQGVEVDLALHADGSTDGRLFVPAGVAGGGEGGVDYEVSLAGTWHIDGADITLHHEADTWLRDVVFLWSEGDVISGEAGLDGRRLDIILTRGEPGM